MSIGEDPGRRDEYPRRPLNSDREALVWQLYGKKCHSVDVLTMRSTTVDRRESQARESASMRVIFTGLQEQL